MADELKNSAFRRFTSSTILEYACRTDMWDLICSLLAQGLQNFDVHPVLLASATLTSIITKNELDKLTDAIVLLEYIHSQFPQVTPRAFIDLLVDVKTKAVMVQLLSNPNAHKRQVYSQLEYYMGCKDCEVERATHVDPYRINLHAEARKRIWDLVSEVGRDTRAQCQNQLLATEFTFDRQQKLVKALHEYLGAIRAKIPCRLYELAETYLQQERLPLPSVSTTKLKDFSIRVPKCNFNGVQLINVQGQLPPPPHPPSCTVDDGYDASESASQPSDFDGEEQLPARSAAHPQEKRVLSLRQRRLVNKKQVVKDKTRIAIRESQMPATNQTTARGVAFSSPEFPIFQWRNASPYRGEAMRQGQSDQEEGCETESPLCVLHIAGSQEESEADQSGPEAPSMMENIAMEATQTPKELVVSDTESGTSYGEKKAYLYNIHNM